MILARALSSVNLKIRFSFLFFVFFLGNPVVVWSALSLRQCQSIASELNKTYPMNADELTIISSAVCVLDGARSRLVYNMTVDRRMSDLTRDDIKQLRPRMVNAWCSDPRQYNLLTQVNIEYRYSRHSGTYIESIQIRQSDCRR